MSWEQLESIVERSAGYMWKTQAALVRERLETLNS